MRNEYKDYEQGGSAETKEVYSEECTTPKCTEERLKRKVSTLIFLVMFVFSVLFWSIAIAGGLTYFLWIREWLPRISTNRIAVTLVWMILFTMLLSTISSIIAGDRILKPLRSLTAATKEIAAGNFAVRAEVGGSDELILLGESFNEMAEQLGSIETLRSDFINNISHEFKTPVVSIRGFARRLKKNNLTEAQRNEYLDIIISESERLAELSSNILLLSRLETTDKVVEQSLYSLDEQIRRSILLLSPQLEKKRLVIEIDMDTVEVMGSEEFTGHIWINLLSNAIKFSKEGGTIDVILRKSGENAIVTVSDTGVGMDKEVKKHIYEKFYQSDTSRATEGNGLGLALVKKILELTDGAIDVESEVGEGARFTVTLPIGYAEQNLSS